ncbi:DNA polymerase III subunit delta [Blastopirellula retiformator]|uniref:DNA polymerase III subunit delta n=1 Tax=Blastopirellula retiformator TaxID=2527970 RepID=A0A5C5V1F8_9BACT|nr:DNA polymerase III subunit delta [Blastopirellula retiformator]TWT31780.1 DNA polymerase III subunit delta [Blastopirellula retiformator]
MSQTVHCFDYLDDATGEVPGVAVVYGREAILARLALRQIRHVVVGGDEEDVPVARLEGKTAAWRDVIDEVGTVSLFGGGSRRLVILDGADDFVSRYRAELEKYVEKPKRSGVLVLVVENWPKSTKLFKKLDATGLQVDCNLPEKKSGKRSVPDAKALHDWMIKWAKKTHQIKLERDAAEMMVELIGPELGLIDQDLARLSLYVEPNGKVSANLVRDVVGGWRMKAIWDLVDAAVEGRTASVLEDLDKLFSMGERPQKLYGQIAWSLRRYAAAARIYQRAQRNGESKSLRNALADAGFPNWPKALDEAQQRVKRLGSIRAGRLFQQLLKLDLSLKGTHSHDDRGRLALERLFVGFSEELDPRHATADRR